MTFKKLQGVMPLVLMAFVLAYVACLTLGTWGSNALAYTIGNEYILPIVYIGGGFTFGLIAAKRLKE